MRKAIAVVATLALGPLGSVTVNTTAGIRERSSCANPLLGTWRLQTFTTQLTDTGETIEPFGAHPGGFLSYGADCRVYAILVRDGRVRPGGAVETDAEKVALFDGMGSYAGTYTIDGATVKHHVDISWNETWTGTTQVREFRVDGEALRIRAKDSVAGREATSTLTWRKVR